MTINSCFFHPEVLKESIVWPAQMQHFSCTDPFIIFFNLEIVISEKCVISSIEVIYLDKVSKFVY